MARLVRLKPTHNEIDRALAVVEIYIDEFHGERRPTRDEVETWFVDNANIGVDEIHYNREYIRNHLDRLI